MTLKIGAPEPKLDALFAASGKATVPVPPELADACAKSFHSSTPFAVSGTEAEVAQTIRDARRWANQTGGRSISCRYPNGTKTRVALLAMAKTARPRKPKPVAVVEAPNVDGTGTVSTVSEDQAAAASG